MWKPRKGWGTLFGVLITGFIFAVFALIGVAALYVSVYGMPSEQAAEKRLLAQQETEAEQVGISLWHVAGVECSDGQFIPVTQARGCWNGTVIAVRWRQWDHEITCGLKEDRRVCPLRLRQRAAE